VRAKRVNENIRFERGQDIKDTLHVGYENARIFNKALQKRDYFEPVLEIMLEGLKEGSIKERDAIRFIDGGIHKYHPRRIISWFEWYEETSNLFWDKQFEQFVITFDLPEIEWFQITKFRKIYCKLYYSENWEKEKNYFIKSYLKITQDDGEVEELFEHSNIFYPGDDIFKMPAVIHNINKTVEATIKNMD
jgi:hypothetical protein